MTVIQINETHIKVKADEGKSLYFGSDTTPYSEIVCKTNQLDKITERDEE